MGVIQDTYLIIFVEATGDQYVDRVIAGLPISLEKFGVIPPQMDLVCRSNGIFSVSNYTFKFKLCM